jgi:hypothetical protein
VVADGAAVSFGLGIANEELSPAWEAALYLA